MKYELNLNNSKKLIIGVSMLFCAVILIVGGSIAFFTQSDSESIDNIVATNINDSIGYDDSVNPYMRQELIPAKEEVAIQAFNLEDDNKCIDVNGFSACSVYQFTIINNSDVTQDLIIDMIPTINTFGNLTYILYEVNEGVSIKKGDSHLLDTITNEMILNNEYKTYNLIKTLKLNPKKSQTYQLLFYINDIGSDQTLVDSGKNFGASIKISSVATGTYLINEFGDQCWTTTQLEDNTYRLDSFIGNDENTITGIKEICNAYYDDLDNDGYYIVNVPARIGEKKITSLGNKLFLPVDDNFNSNINSQIKKINISEGITKVEDGYQMEVPGLGNQNLGTFTSLGFNSFEEVPIINGGVEINFPSTLKYLGDYAFNNAYLKSVELPDGLEFIGNRAFGNMRNEISFEIPYTVHTIDSEAFVASVKIKNVIFAMDANGDSRLKYIGDGAFGETDIQSLIIPSSVEYIGDEAFRYSDDLTSLTFEEGSKLKYIGDGAFEYTIIKTLIIPSSVTYIGSNAFARYNSSINITTLVFEGAQDGTSKLRTIGDRAFGETDIQSLIIPSSVETIGEQAFYSNMDLTSLIFAGALDGTSKLKTIGYGAFWNTNLLYETENNPLILPSNIEYISSDAFWSYDPKLNYIYFVGDSSKFDDGWNNSDATIITKLPNQ